MNGPLSTAQIGRSGELLVQYLLLLRGIESAPLSTDSGIDLVAYSPKKASAFTIQVKTNLKAKPGGGKGKGAFDWWIEDNSPAQIAAFVALSEQRVWIVKTKELAALSQQHSGGRYHFYMYIDPAQKRHVGKRPAHMHHFEKYLLENRSHALFGI